MTPLRGMTAEPPVAPDREAITMASAYDAARIAESIEQRHAAASKPRITSFDFVKGALVLVMVLYHWLNYFIGLQWGGYRYLRFLTPSFIFITGFLISRVYLSKYGYDDPRLRRRLWRRGLKLLAVFLVLNVVADRTLGMRLRLNFGDVYALRDALYAVFVEGSARAAFDILVSISYFLLLAPFVLFVSGRLRISLWVFAAAAIISTLIAEASGLINPHLEMLSVALLGLAAGTLRGRAVAFSHSPVAVLAAYVIYVATIALWNVPFPLQVVGVCLSVLALHTIAQVCGSTGLLQRYIVRLGEYSLLAYIAQIIVLQILRRGLRGYELSGAGLAVPLAIGIISTIAAVEATAWLRPRSAVVDQSYRTAFA
jgi:peptidoglycan/LPS O-acetylase OafA/YrhL